MIYWYKIKDEDILLKALNQYYDTLKKGMNNVHNQCRIFQNFFDNIQANYFNTHSFNKKLSEGAITRKRFAYNCIQPIIEDTFNSMAKIKPKPTFINANFLYSQKTKIKRIDSWTLNVIKKEKVYKKSEMAMKDSHIRDIGICKTMPGDNAPKIFKVDIFNFFIPNPYEGSDEKDVACEMNMKSLYEIYEKFYPKMSEKNQKMFLEKYKIEDPDIQIAEGKFTDKTIEVREIFKAGHRHIIWVEDCLLIDEDWKYPWIPYDFCYWIFPQQGVIGSGISQILTALQTRANVLLRKLSKSIDISLFPYVLAHITAKVGKKYTDEAGNIIEWQGSREPKHITQPITHPQVFEHFYHMIDMMYRTVRKDQQAVLGNLPQGVNKGSGIAVQNIQTVEQAKYYSPAEIYEMFVTGIAKKMAMYGYHENYNGLRDDINDDEFFDNIQTWPTAIFPYTPEGKVARAETMINLGFYTPEEVADVYDFPDVSNTISSKGARISAIFRKIEQGLEMKENIVPDPVLGYVEQNDIGLKIYAKLMLEDKKKYKREINILQSFLKLCGAELKRIEMERMEAALQGNLPTELPNPPAPTPPTANDQEALAESGTGQGTNQGGNLL